MFLRIASTYFSFPCTEPGRHLIEMLLAAQAFALVVTGSFELQGGVQMRNETINKCPGNCSGRGLCTGSMCTCSPGYAGSDCSLALPLLPWNQATSTAVPANNWQFLELEIPSGTGWQLRLQGTQGDMDYFVAFGR